MKHIFLSDAFLNNVNYSLLQSNSFAVPLYLDKTIEL